MSLQKINIAATRQNIERFRIESGMTVRDMRKALGFTEPRTFDDVLKFALVFKVPLEEILVIDTTDDTCD